MSNKLYEETSVQAIANALRLKQNGSDTTYTISQMDDGVLSLPTGNLPSYHREEAARVVKKLLDLKASSPNSIIFGTIADNHVDKSNASTMTSARHAVYALESVGSMVCDFVANLGDNISGTNIDNDTDYANAVYMENASRYAMTNLTAFNLVGNHCKSNSTQKIYDLIGKYNEFDTDATTKIRGFGYQDFASQKVRVIVLNTCDYWNTQGGNGMSYEQKDFFMKALDLSAKSDYSHWTIIVLSHIPLDYLGGDYNKGADLKAILKAYNNGTSVTININNSYATAENESPIYYDTYNGSGTLFYDYSGKNAPKLINIHGHVHTNCYGKLTFIDDNTQLNMVRVATPNSAFNQNASTNRYTEYGNYSITATEAAKIKKVASSEADTSATFYLIDLDKQVIYAVGYGADIDRTIPYKDAITYSVSYTLTDVTSSNTSETAVEGTAFSTTLSVGSGYALDTVTVKMSGSTITSSCYDPENGRINIANVTGDIVITAKAVENYVPHWDIADRTAITGLYEEATKAHACVTSRHNYICGISGEGLIHTNQISNVAVNGNDVTFKSDLANMNIGLPYQLEAGASYTFKATASQAARLRVATFDRNGLYVSNSSTYSSSGTNLSHTFTATADEGYWTVVMLDVRTAGNTTTFSNISLTKN